MNASNSLVSVVVVMVAVAVVAVIQMIKNTLCLYGGRVPVHTTPGPVPVYRALKSLPLVPTNTARDAWPLAKPALTCRCQAHNGPSGQTSRDAKRHGPAHEEESIARGEKSPAKPATVV